MEESVISEDRLSKLPLSLIHLILSFLPMRDVVSTTLLSKHWNGLWTTIPYLNFSGNVSKYTDDGVQRFRNFVNRTLELWNGSKILKFEIGIYNIFEFSLTSDIDSWMRFAVENKVEELKIYFSYDDDILYWKFDQVVSIKEDVYWAPQCLNSCSSIRKLSLSDCNIRIHGSPLWNQLKTLIIDGFCFSESLIDGILLGSPQLEVFELHLMESFENLNIQSTSLKRLEITKYTMMDNDPISPHTMLKICCPNLETLVISGLLYCKCLFTDVSSLTDVTLDFRGRHFDDDGVYRVDELLGEKLRQIFSAIQHVEKVALSHWCVQVLGASPKKYLINPFPNVKFWKLDSWVIEFTDLMHLLGIFPNLEVLEIEPLIFRKPPNFNTKNYKEFETNISPSFLRQLKKVEITSYLCTSSILKVIEFLLKHSTRLENLVFRVEGFKPNQQKMVFEISDKLLRMPRSSPTAKVIFSPKYDRRPSASEKIY